MHVQILQARTPSIRTIAIFAGLVQETHFQRISRRGDLFALRPGTAVIRNN